MGLDVAGDGAVRIAAELGGRPAHAAHLPMRRVPSRRLDVLRLQFLIASAAPSEEGPSLLGRGLRGYDYVILVSRTIASGLAEIQLYAMATRGLGLPRS